MFSKRVVYVLACWAGLSSAALIENGGVRGDKEEPSLLENRDLQVTDDIRDSVCVACAPCLDDRSCDITPITNIVCNAAICWLFSRALCTACGVCDFIETCVEGDVIDAACGICEVAGANPDDGFGGAGCFSDRATVQVQGRTLPVGMANLNVGDRILTAQGDYETVYAFGHLQPTKLATFLQIHHGNNSSYLPLEVTPEHLVFVEGKIGPVSARDIQVGDKLQGGSSVTQIHSVQRRGLYAPLTTSGNLLVDGVAASSYIALRETDQEYYQIELAGYNMNLASHQSVVHLCLVPFRMMCMGVSSGLCQVLDEEGMPPYISLGMKLLHWANEQNTWFKLLFLVVTLPAYLVLMLVEKLVGPSNAPFLLFSLILQVLAKRVLPMVVRNKKKDKIV